VSFRYFILGLLSQQPMSGYDIKRFLDHLDWLIGSPSFGSLYPALHSLLEDELVSVDVVRRKSKPTRKIYTIEEKGRQALDGWMAEPMEDDASLKTFLMRLMLANNLSRANLVDYLEQRRSQVALYRESLQPLINQENRPEDPDLGQRLALDYGLAVAAAELAWLDQALKQLKTSSWAA
jgi:DNA-binding PadR family transcriptional regulator